MTDGQWALLAPLLPAAGSSGGRGGRPEKWDRRLVLDAIFYLVRGGIAWRALPADFPPHQTVYALFRRWTRARAWCRNAALRERARLADGRGPVPTACLQDRDGAFRITAALREAFSTITLVWADAGYTGRFVRDAQDLGPGRGDRQAPRPGQGLRPAPPPLGRGTLLRLADQIRRLVRDYETLPATHEAMIWTAATWQLSNRLTR